jgi:hypothetical protein
VFGKSLMRKISELIVGVLRRNEYLKGKGMEFSEKDLWYVVTVKSLE